MRNKVKHKAIKIGIMITFILGISMLSFSLFSNIIFTQKVENILATYEKNIETADESKKQQMLENAKKYNENLAKHGVAYYDENAKINIDVGNGIIGRIEIPIIDVYLPIYNGTSDEVLSNGVGHLEGTSLPIGGKSTHSVLTAHRGLPNAKLFTRLDELKKGDMFYISVLGEEMAYEVNEIREVLPDDTSLFNVTADKDIVSLVTCTPYGINTHRLIVTGERVPFEKQVKEDIKPKIMSVRELVFIILPISFLVIAIIIYILERRKKLNENSSKDITDNNVNNTSNTDNNS